MKIDLTDSTWKLYYILLKIYFMNLGFFRGFSHVNVCNVHSWFADFGPTLTSNRAASGHHVSALGGTRLAPCRTGLSKFRVWI